MKLKKRVKFSIFEREKARKNRTKSDYSQVMPIGRGGSGTR